MIQLKSIALIIIGIPVMVAIVVGGPMIWWDARTNFGLHATDNFGFGVSISLASIAVFIAARAFLRVRAAPEAERSLPLALNWIFPLQVLVGIALGLFVFEGVHEQRTETHTYFATKYCAEVLCPVPDGEYLYADDCAPAQPGSSCFDIGRACQREMAGVDFEQRERAVMQCVRDRLSTP